MHLGLRALLTALVLALLLLRGQATPAWAEDEPSTAPREIAVPRHGLSVKVPAGWAIDIYGDAALALSKGSASIWFRVAEDDGRDGEKQLARMAARLVAGEDAKPLEVERWPVAGSTGGAKIAGLVDGAWQFHGIVARETRGGFHVEARVDPEADPLPYREAEGILRSTDVRLFVHDTRIVDYTLGFTTDLPDDHRVSRDATGQVRFTSQKPSRLIKLERASEEDTDGKAILERTFARLKAGGVSLAATEMSGPDKILTATLPLGGKRIPAHTAVVTLTREGRPPARMAFRAARSEGLAITVASDPDAAGYLPPLDALKHGAHPGPRVGEDTSPTAARTGWTREGAPAIDFVLPSGWSLIAETRPMRLGRAKLPGDLELIAYAFGGGQGGGLEANIARWAGASMWKSKKAEPATTTIEACPSITATTVYVAGHYIATMSPRGGPRFDEPDFAMLNAWIPVGDTLITLKLVGPRTAIDAVRDDYTAWLKTWRPASN